MNTLHNAVKVISRTSSYAAFDAIKSLKLDITSFVEVPRVNRVYAMKAELTELLGATFEYTDETGMVVEHEYVQQLLERGYWVCHDGIQYYLLFNKMVRVNLRGQWEVL